MGRALLAALVALALALALVLACSRPASDDGSSKKPSVSASASASEPQGDYDPDPSGPHFPCGPNKKCHFDTVCVITQAAEPIAICTMHPKTKGCTKTGDRVWVCPGKR